MKKDPVLYAIYILENIKKITEYVQSAKGDFLCDEKTYDAVLRRLQTLSEATRYLDDDCKSKSPHIPWDKIWGFRNILVHNYLGDIALEEIAIIVKKDLPRLQKAIEEYYGSLDVLLRSPGL